MKIENLFKFVLQKLEEARASQVALAVKNPLAKEGDVRDAGSIPEKGRIPGGGYGNSSSILAWRIPQTQELGGLQSMGSQKSGA